MAEDVSIIAVLSVVIAFFSIYISDIKLSSDLFNKRFAAYGAIIDKLSPVLDKILLRTIVKYDADIEISNGEFLDVIFSLNKQSLIVRYLFPLPVYDKLREIIRTLESLRTSYIGFPEEKLAADLEKSQEFEKLLKDKYNLCHTLLDEISTEVYPFLRQRTMFESLRHLRNRVAGWLNPVT
ncbi:MAG: hypothetical protein LBR29_10845 [Methylobacteriaceae bacterium]|jgi:hypothetical protein|nr:hypothetical protein [Methylobacteriaceae bacterium]